LLGLPLSSSASIDERLGGVTPLVLKDGRIANVTVHTIPFATGAAELDDAAAAEFEATFRPLATDCFLTAQAIGHVAPGITRDGDTLAAHRLARARADGIQKTLAGFGMPEPAVASVWDWQFLVEESQVTLWVFSLNVGDDCEGTPLSVDTPVLADAAPAQPALPEAVSEPVAALSAPAADEPEAAAPMAATRPAGDAPAAPRELQLADETAPDDPTGDAGPAATAASVAVPSSAAEPAGSERVAEEADEATDPLATAAVAPAVATTPATDPAGGVSDLQPTGEAETVVAAIDEEATSATGATAAPELVITFDVNSSFFPAGASRQLRTFLDGLPATEPVALEVAGAVGTGDVRGASGEDAERYNAWMAERRIQRVTEWLQQNAGNRPITVTERLVANDSSREVRLYTEVKR
jgi:hypothetical protein